jgi:hypothetical protein
VRHVHEPHDAWQSDRSFPRQQQQQGGLHRDGRRPARDSPALPAAPPVAGSFRAPGRGRGDAPPKIPRHRGRQRLSSVVTASPAGYGPWS